MLSRSFDEMPERVYLGLEQSQVKSENLKLVRISPPQVQRKG